MSRPVSNVLSELDYVVAESNLLLVMLPRLFFAFYDYGQIWN